MKVKDLILDLAEEAACAGNGIRHAPVRIFSSGLDEWEVLSIYTDHENEAVVIDIQPKNNDQEEDSNG